MWESCSYLLSKDKMNSQKYVFAKVWNYQCSGTFSLFVQHTTFGIACIQRVVSCQDSVNFRVNLYYCRGLGQKGQKRPKSTKKRGKIKKTKNANNSSKNLIS